MNVRLYFPLALCLSLTTFSCSPSKYAFENTPQSFTLEEHLDADLPGEVPEELPAPGDLPKPADLPEPAESPKPDKPSKPAESPKPDEPSKPAETPKPDEPSKPAASPKPAEPSKPAEAPKPDETPKLAESPDLEVHPGNKPDEKEPKNIENSGNEKPEIASEFMCGKKLDKVLVCHIPPGNPAAAHNICISIQGALHGHGVPLDGSVGIAGDHLGPCPAVE